MAKHKQKIKKTNAMRALDQVGASYQVYSYDSADGHNDGISVAHKINCAVDDVYKTLVTQGQSGQHYVFVVPVAHNLNLKKAAMACAEKKIEMIAVKDIINVTGYVKGGCSPLAMKKQYPTWLDRSASSKEKIVFSAGVIGTQIETAAHYLIQIIGAQYADICD